jgi:hypothetical protein
VLDRWRRFAAAAEADAGDDLDAVAARLLEQGFRLDAAMLAAIERRRAEIQAAVLELGAREDG